MDHFDEQHLSAASELPSDDGQLVRAVQAGDEDAFRRLMLAYYNPVLRFAYTLMRSVPAAEDLTQDVFERIWDTRTQLDPTRSIKAYLFTTTRNRALNALKHQAAVQRVEARAAWEAAEGRPEPIATTPEDDFFDRVTAAAEAGAVTALVQAIAELPERRRTVLALRFEQQLTFRGIGEVLGISEKAAQQLVIRTLAELRQKLRP